MAIPTQVVRGADVAAAAGTPSKLTAALSSYLATRVGTVGLALMDSVGRTFGYSSRMPNETLSTIKVLVLIAHLRRCQAQGTPLTSAQRSLATRMICFSDNAATDQLIAQIGLTRMQQVARDLGMTSTVVRSGSYGTSWWGYSVSTPADMLKLMHAAMWGRTYLTDSTASTSRA
jgi:beta-lactamase class A